MLRLSLSAARNHLATIRRRGEGTTEAVMRVRLTRLLDMDKLERSNREYWAESLDNRDNIWKAYIYTKSCRANHSIPVLKVGHTEAAEEREKADLLLDSSFPVSPEPVDREGTWVKPRLAKRRNRRPHEYAGKKSHLRIKLPKLTLDKVEAAMMQSK